MDTSDVPVNLIWWSLALLPIVVLLVLLAVRGWKAAQAGPVGFYLATVIALFAFDTPFETLAVSVGKGVWDAVFILYVVWPALLLYRVIENAGGFEALRRGVLRFSRNELFLVLGFGWVFASFLQGITGFGTPIAVVAPLLVAIGVRPVYAVLIPLIGHSWANLFGTLAVAWLGTQQVVEFEDPRATALQTAVMLWPTNLLAGLAIAWFVGRWAGIRHAWPMIVVVSSIHGGGQLVLALWNPVLSNFLATTAAVLALYPLSRWDRFSEDPDGVEERPAMDPGREGGEDEQEPEAVMRLGMAVVPYVVLTVVAVGTVAIGPLESVLEQLEVGLPFPSVDTGYGVTNDAADPYNPFAPLTHPGTFLLIAAGIAWLLYRRQHFYERWKAEGERDDAEQNVTPIGIGVVSDALPASLAIVSFLALSQVMDHSGQTETLALGVSAVAPSGVFAFFSGLIGVLGAFMTSSNTSSNIIFGPLQDTVADAEGLSQATIISAQQAGGAVGNSVSPANIVLGTGAAGVVGAEGEVLRRSLPYAAASIAIVGVVTLAFTPW